MTLRLRLPVSRVLIVVRLWDGGGVGFYPKDDFVHVDVGRVRRW